MADPVAVLNRMAGCGRWRDLLLAGVPESALRRAVESGAVVRHGSGVYALPGTSQQRIAVYRAAGVPACLNAAQDRGWWILQPPTTPHIAVDHGRPVPEVIKHRSRLPLSALDIVLQVLHCAPELDALVVLCSAIRTKEVSIQEVAQRLCGQRSAKARSILQRFDPHSESVLEVASRFQLENAGFIVASQVYLPGLGRMDQLIDGVLALELMGKEFHLSAAAFEEDLRRFNQYTVSGVPVLRVGYAQVIYRPAEFIALVRQALATISAIGSH
ncbi:MAG: type IV toxin-antitoxin system AbiEi family antitoxin domain-containing protein [Renibacterium sp.]|nr:type IV toxin-antitoxin system AbiEi family antitoxin domain-containing protein [Renibacterium sp.]